MKLKLVQERIRDLTTLIAEDKKELGEAYMFGSSFGKQIALNYYREAEKVLLHESSGDGTLA